MAGGHYAQQSAAATPTINASSSTNDDCDMITVNYNDDIVTVPILPPFSLDSSMLDIFMSEDCIEVFQFVCEDFESKMFHFEVQHKDSTKSNLVFHSSFLKYSVKTLIRMKGVSVDPVNIMIVMGDEL